MTSSPALGTCDGLPAPLYSAIGYALGLEKDWALRYDQKLKYTEIMGCST